MTAVDWQGLKDIIIVLGALLAIWLGYRLYVHGVDITKDTVAELRTRLLTISMNGGGPGLGSMFLGSAILIVALMVGRATSGSETIGGGLASMFSDSLQRAPRDETPLDDTQVKKLAEESLSKVTVSGIDIAPAIRRVSLAEAARHLQNAGAETVFNELATGDRYRWATYVSRMRDATELGVSIFALRTLELAVLDGEDLRTARLTHRGELVYDYLEEERTERDLSEGLDGLRSIEQRPSGDLPSLTIGERRDDSFDSEADNWYRLSISGKGNYVLRTDAPMSESTTGDVDTTITLYNENDNIEGFDDDSGRGTYSQLREELSEGTYYLQVSSLLGLQGQYSLLVDSVQDGIESDALRPIDDTPATVLRPSDGPLDVSLTTRSDAWYLLEVPEPGRYVIKTFADEAWTELDTTIQLYANDRQTLIGDDDDSGDGLHAQLVENLDMGNYYIRTGTFWGEAGDYRIDVEQRIGE